jgi:hypothetical protein
MVGAFDFAFRALAVPPAAAASSASRARRNALSFAVFCAHRNSHGLVFDHRLFSILFVLSLLELSFGSGDLCVAGQ